MMASIRRRRELDCSSDSPVTCSPCCAAPYVSRWCKRARAFTLIELLAVISIIGLLAMLLLPVLVRAKTRAQSIQCMNNLKQFSYAWIIYAEDHDEVIAPNSGAIGPWSQPNPAWVLGYLDPDNFESWGDNTNTIRLTQSLLASYLGWSIPIWHCPADRSSSRYNGQYLPRVRSYAMNQRMNSAWEDIPDIYKTIRKVTDMISPSPSGSFVFIDQREDSIQDSVFGVDMDNEPATMSDIPRSAHAGAGTLSFADGHAEIKKWKDPRTSPFKRKHGFVEVISSWPPNPDVLWLRALTTGKQ